MRFYYFPLIWLLVAPVVLRAQQAALSWKVVPSLPVLSNGRPSQLISYRAPSGQQGELRIICTQQRGGDSVILYQIAYPGTKLQAGTATLWLPLDRGRIVKSHPDLRALLQRCGSLPPGVYQTRISFVAGDSTLFSTTSLDMVDSTLPVAGRLRRKANALLSGGSPAQLSDTAATHHIGSVESRSTNNRPVAGAAQRLNGGLLRKERIEAVPQQIGSSTYTALYYGDWFLGRYKVPLAGQAMQTAAAEYQTLRGNTGALVTSSMEDFRSTGDQVRDLFAARKEEKEITGNIDLLTAFGTGQEPGSQQDNNYTEIGGTIATEVWDIPVSIEGYYTTQDRRRVAKASFIRFHYDAQRASSELAGLISTYRQKFGEAAARGAGLGQVYGSYTSRLQGERGQLMGEFGREYGVSADLLSSAGNTSELMSRLSADSAAMVSGAVSRVQDSASKDSAAAAATKSFAQKKARLLAARDTMQRRYEQLQALEQRIGYYNKLLTQYRDKLSLDSSLNYKRIEEISGRQDVSYKELSQAAVGLLPEGKVKRFATGLTHFDAGIIDRYESSYTMAGQTIKGGSVGYDLGIVKVGATLGKTEYVSREGSIDRYSSYLGRLDFKPFLGGQKVSLLYCGNSPSRQMLRSNNFIHTDAAAPSFRNPVHIVSLVWEGKIGKDLNAGLEGATSFGRGLSATPDWKHSALKGSADYLITRFSTSLRGEYEHIGAGFDNSALPYLRAATDRYTAAVSTELFRSFLSATVSYNHLRQEAFAGTGHNARWGFEVRTRSKRYPSIMLSYKPFSTFRTYNDTLSTAQRPLFGEVWTGRGSWQLKRHGVVQRFTLLYNRSTSTMDTVAYSSSTLQAGYSYTQGGRSLGLNLGKMTLPLNYADGSGRATSWFGMLSGSGNLTKTIQLIASQEVAIAAFGLQRLATTAGGSVSLKRWPVQLRAGVRYSRYRLSEADVATNQWNGQLGFGWRFRAVQ